MKTKFILSMSIMMLVFLLIGCQSPNDCESPTMSWENSETGESIVATLSADQGLDNYKCSLYVQDFTLKIASGETYRTVDYSAAFSAQDSIKIIAAYEKFSLIQAQRPIISGVLDPLEYYAYQDAVVPSRSVLHLQLKDEFGENPKEVLATLTFPLRAK